MIEPYGLDCCFEPVLFYAFCPILSLSAPFVADVADEVVEVVDESFVSDEELEVSANPDPFLFGDDAYKEVELDVSFKTANSYIPSCGSPYAPPPAPL